MKKKVIYSFVIFFFNIFLLLFSVLNANGLFAQSTYWIHRGGGTSVDEGMDIAVDANGNSYATGFFSGTVTFGPSSSAVSLTSKGVSDIYVVKINSSGIVQWAVKAGGSGPDRGLAIAVDANGNSYVTGFFQGTAAFGSVTLNASSGSQDMFAAKYDSTGTLQWAKNAGGSNVDIGNGIAVDYLGNVIVTGQFQETAKFGNLTLTAATNPSTKTSSIDVFTIKYDAAGKELWVKQGAAPYTDRGMDVACDPLGNIYVTGQFSDTITFDATHNNNAYNAIFLLKYNSSGSEQWFNKIAGGAQNIAYGIAVDKNGNVYLTGDFIENLIFFATPSNISVSNSSSNSVFIAKYSSSGVFQWAEADTSSSEVSARNIALDDNGNPYIIGNFRCKFSEYSNEYGDGTFNSVGYRDVFVARYDTSGIRKWAQQFGGQDEDNGAGIALDKAAQIYVTGTFNQRVTFPIPSTSIRDYNYVSITSTATPYNYCSENNYGVYSFTNSLGYSDIFIAKALDQNRQPYDYYKRTGTSCDKSFVGVCIDINNSSYESDRCGADSAEACGSLYIVAKSNTDMNYYNRYIGPTLRYLWSTGDTTRNLYLTKTGKYSVILSTRDGCFSSKDTIYATINPYPSTPSVNPQYTTLCAPDSVTITFGNIDPNTTHLLKGTGLPAAGIDTNIIKTTITSSYTYTVTNQQGCSRSNYASVNMQSAPKIDTILPKVVLTNDPDHNDSIEICTGNNFQMYIYDSISNPTGIQRSVNNMSVTWAITPTPDQLQGNWDASKNTPSLKDGIGNVGDFYRVSAAGVQNMGSGNQSFAMGDFITYSSNGKWIWQSSTLMTYSSTYNPVTYFTPSASGLYQLDATVTISASSTCGKISEVYHVSKNVYVAINPYPVVDNPITGNTVICQGETTTLRVPKADSYVWNNYLGGITGIISATNTDSIQVNLPGTYCNTSTITRNGCSKSKRTCTTIAYRSAPTITMSPGTGLICPNDSITLTTTSGAKYEWYGPITTGIGIVGTTQSIKVNTPGYYYCIVTDSSGCVLTSNSAEAKQYSTPFLYAAPSTFICPGKTATISVATNAGSTITWGSPFNGSNKLSQTVSTEGNYTATVVSCGITTSASLKITSAVVPAKITASGPLDLCEGDSVTLYANKGMSNYKWIPGNAVTDSIVVKQAGKYTVTTTDGNGCSATTSSVSVSINKKLSPPTVSDTSICKGRSVTLTASSSGIIEWYSDSAGINKLSTGSQYTTPIITQNTTYYVQTPVAYCDTIRVPLNVRISVASLPPVIRSNTPVCEGDTLMLETDSATGLSYSWSGPNNFNSTMQSIVIPNVDSVYSGNYTLALVGGGCIGSPSSTLVVVKKTPPVPSVNNNSPLCEGATLILKADTLNSGANITYMWAGPGNFNSLLPYPEISNITVSDSGEYSLELSLNGCLSPKVTTIVYVKPRPPSPGLRANTPLCEGETLFLYADSIPNANYYWEGPGKFNSSDQNPEINAVAVEQAGVYSVVATMDECTSAGEKITIVVHPLPEVNIHDEKIICSDEDPFILNPGNYDSYLWQDSSTTPTFYVSVPGKYKVRVTKFGCTTSDSVIVEEQCPPTLYIPNAFTPNNDMANDVFNVKGTSITSYWMRIFNRWGELIFETNDLNYGWDGRYKGSDVQEGVYVWVVYAEGFEKDRKVGITRTGHVTLIR